MEVEKRHTAVYRYAEVDCGEIRKESRRREFRCFRRSRDPAG